MVSVKDSSMYRGKRSQDTAERTKTSNKMDENVSNGLGKLLWFNT